MISASYGKGIEEVQEELGSSPIPNGSEGMARVPFHMSSSQRGLLGQENPQKGSPNVSTALPSRVGILKFGSTGLLASPSAKFLQISEERDEVSRSVPSSASQGSQNHFNLVFVQKINWVSLRKICKEWIRNPMNLALLVWITCVAVSGAILFLVMTGMLNNVLPRKSQRDAWFEVNNQILNALFTLMCLYQHPKRFHHLVLLFRWQPGDISDNEVVREALGVTGIVLCVFGLLYGGFWRIQMRKKFKLPDNGFCCGKPAVTDCAQWLFCCSCSLAQEVRTVDFYDIVEDKLYKRQTEEGYRTTPCEVGSFQSTSGPSSLLQNNSSSSKLRMESSSSPSGISKEYYNPDMQLFMVEEESSTKGTDNTMAPPVSSLIQRDDNQQCPV
ncbi:PREDICTED: uncharacterized protein LOC104606081 [Nelumbo nucifera]|uniref:Uncharacterized protein LOC104606081 n=1 Tax=Nelumbo nucifera TaxID=4432 RepID=A0A1U8ASQ0_NELNU|nr:PREDICTED: uncharacterized protein LOC104606081 [Nelumbo nucifera]